MFRVSFSVLLTRTRPSATLTAISSVTLARAETGVSIVRIEAMRTARPNSLVPPTLIANQPPGICSAT